VEKFLIREFSRNAFAYASELPLSSNSREIPLCRLSDSAARSYSDYLKPCAASAACRHKWRPCSLRRPHLSILARLDGTRFSLIDAGVIRLSIFRCSLFDSGRVVVHVDRLRSRGAELLTISRTSMGAVRLICTPNAREYRRRASRMR